jgi:DNA modification methylase
MRVEKIGLATLYLGDCREIAPTLERPAAVITDPPYGINFQYDGYDDSRENLKELISWLMPWAKKTRIELSFCLGLRRFICIQNLIG